MVSITQHNYPIFIIIRGLPGSGKTYLAHQLLTALGGSEVVMLDPDATDYQSESYKTHVETMHAQGVDPALHAYRYLRGQAYQGIADRKIIIWNQPFTNLEIFHKMVANLRLQAEEHQTTLPLLIVEMAIDPAVARQRVVERKSEGGHGPSEATFQRFTKDYRSFADAGYNTVTINGDQDLKISVRQVLQAIEDLKIPTA